MVSRALTFILAPRLLVSHEFQFVLGVLLYLQERLMSTPAIESSRKSRNLEATESAVGSFLNLHCGHNNPFSRDERMRLLEVLQQATGGSNTTA